MSSSSVLTFFVIHVFSALLPPVNPEDKEYYELLGLDVSKRRSITPEQIRKAYKVKSLQLHPDKLAQRGQRLEDATAAFQQVQQAYNVLSDEPKRRLYHQLSCSPTRFEFWEEGNGLSNPTAVVDNLASASFVNKTRLVLLLMTILGLVLLQPVLLATKLNHLLDQDGALESTRWMLILIPLWFFQVVLCTALVLNLMTNPSAVSFAVTMEQLAAFVGEVLIALRWDRTVDWEWRVVLIPIYLALFFRWLYCVATLRQVAYDVENTFVTETYLNETILDAPLDDLPEEEQHKILETYVIVHIPDEEDVDTLDPETGQQLTGEDLEVKRIQASVEYEAAMMHYQQTVDTLWHSVIFGTTFLVLLVLKLQGTMNASWWVVFVPIWTYLGIQIFSSTFGVCCGSVVGDEVFVEMSHGDEEDEDVEEASPNDADGTSPRISVQSGREYTDFENPEDSIRKEEKGESNSNGAVEETVEEQDNSKREPHQVSKEERSGQEEAEEEDSSQKEPNKDDNEKTPAEEPFKEEVVQEYSSARNGDAAADDDMPHIDEETYQQWQRAYARAENSALEAQAKSQASCCIACFQTMLLCLVVAKLEKEYENEGSPGFNAMWILFPVLLITGLLFLCCACLVYGAGGASGGLHEFMDQHSNDDEDQPASSPAVVVPPPAEPPATKPLTDENEVSEKKPKNDEAQEEPLGDVESGGIDDLD